MAPSNFNRPEWWTFAAGLRTFQDMQEAAEIRLHHAAKRIGWANEAEASAYLCSEPWALLSRMSGGWPGICEDSTPKGLAAVAEELANHLWDVQTGARMSMANREDDAKETATAFSKYMTQGLPETSASSVTVPPEEQIITGADLARVLAHILNNDADLTPVKEAAQIHIRLYQAVEITQELFSQWKENGHQDKATFKRILTKRLQGLMPNPPGGISGRMRPFGTSLSDV